MSHKTIILFCIWTSVWSAIFNLIYTNVFSYGIPWIMFVCLAIYFGMDCKPKQAPALLLCAFCGLAWGQLDFILMNLFANMGMDANMSGFTSIVVGTAISMYVHIKLLGNTPLGYMPFIFAGVCLTFSQGGSNVDGLAVTFIAGILLAAICSAGQIYFMKKFPLQTEAE